MKSIIKLFAFPDIYKTNQMCEKVVSIEPIMLKYYPERCNMCDKAVDACMPALKFVSD